ncbi:MAG: ABC transporter permease [Acidobacteria bacterium]|uniref:ABC transporter permease n=1 Tax=Candidatus Sulfomarinibacter kjeldsenii TaxID=2885994 RepID=A0A8J6Y4I1_9BACT|nr:ABC transporter permease [Candidatus Sulfomarinibacter kjeldsenii]
MQVHRILAVIRREYLERVKTKAFWISTILVPIFLGAVMILPAWLAARGGGEFSVAVLDLSGRFFEPVRDEVGRLLSGDDEKLSVTLLSQEPGPDIEATRERLKNEVQNKEFDGLLVIPASMPDEGQPDYVAPNVAAFKLLTVIERSVNNVMVADRLTDAGLDPEAVRELTRRVGLNTLKLGKGGEETSDQGQTFMLAYVFMMIIYMTVLMYGIYVMRGVLEEKSSHVVEVIISTVKPFELMLGKILGIGAVGLTQFLIWAALMAAISAPGAVAAVGISGMELPAIPAQLLFFFVVYFVLGFLLYGTLYAGIGAAFDTEQEAQNFQGVVTMFLIVQILNQPDGTLSVVLSLIPFFTPMLMFLRMTLTQVPLTQLAASVVLMVGAILFCTWIVAKIYRVGILMHGSKPKFKDLVRWVREA